jgi:hypothetical protein
VQGFDVAFELGPGLRVIQAGVEELAAAQSGVSVFAEVAGEGYPVGVSLDNGGGVAEDAGLAREMAGEERGARGIAERELAVVAVEADAVRAECIDVWAVRVEAAVVAGKLGAHVVGHEEEDVEGALALRAGCRLQVAGCRLLRGGG